MNTEKLKYYREKNEYTMQELANIIGVTKSSYSLWEENIEQIPLERLICICDLFNISIDYIINNTSTTHYEKTTKGLDKTILANNIKNLRKELKYSQQKFASILNVGRTTIINYEQGNTTPQLHHIIFLSQKYNISADYLLGKTDTPKYLK